MRKKNQEYFPLLERFIDTYADSQGVSPSTREIAAGTGLSTATVSRYLSYMRDNGMIDYADQVSDVLGISRTKAYQLMYAEDFPKIQIGKRMVARKEHFIAWIGKESGISSE